MTFDNSFTLLNMREEAQKQFTQAGERINDIENTLTERLGGKTKNGIIGTIAVSLLWGATYMFAFPYVQGSMLEGMFNVFPVAITYLPKIGLALSLALVAAIVIGQLLQLKYYGVIFKVQAQLAMMKRRIDMGSIAFEDNTRWFMECRRNQWEQPLQPGSSIIDETRWINAQLSGLESINSGLIHKLKNVLYYLVCIIWTFAGSCGLFDWACELLYSADLSYSTSSVISKIAIVVACFVELLVAKSVWGKTDCSVGNLTMIATLLGPVVFALLSLLVFLVIIVVQIVIAIAAVVIGIVCVLGSIGGG